MKKIYIDAGHGGRDPGAVGNGMRESDIVLEVALRLGEILAADFDIRQSRTEDVALGINDRWQAANAWGADLLVSIHANAGGGTGVETLIPTASPNNSGRDLQASRRLAEIVSNTLANAFNMRVRRANGVMLETETRHGSIGVLRHSRMLAILPELAFIDSPLSNPDVEVLRNRRGEMAAALAEGIYSFFGVTASVAAPPVEAVPPTVALDILGNVQDIRGYIENGETFVRLTEFTKALGYAATWDGARRIPVISQAAPANQAALETVDGDTLLAGEEDMRLLKILTHWEARGEDLKGQILITNVVFNRMNSPQHPDTLRGVIFHPNAFTPTQREDFNRAIPSALTIEAVNKALSGVDHSQGATFFHAIRNSRGEVILTPDVFHERATREGRLITLFDHGNHRFYREA